MPEGHHPISSILRTPGQDCNMRHIFLSSPVSMNPVSPASTGSSPLFPPCPHGYLHPGTKKQIFVPLTASVLPLPVPDGFPASLSLPRAAVPYTDGLHRQGMPHTLLYISSVLPETVRASSHTLQVHPHLQIPARQIVFSSSVHLQDVCLPAADHGLQGGLKMPHPPGMSEASPPAFQADLRSPFPVASPLLPMH